MNPSDINSPHDKLFRASMQHPEVRREFLNTHLPEDIKNKIDFNSIITCPNTFIDEELKLSQSDVLFKATINGVTVYIYTLVEHQSTPDPLMPFRLLKYITKIWDYHQSQTKQKKGLPFPVIFPIIFYTGKRAYNAPRTIWELCGAQSELMRRILQKPFCLVDVNTMPEDQMTSRAWSGTMEYIMRHRFRQHISQELDAISDNINHLMLEENRQFVLQLFTYMLEIDDEHHTTEELIELIRSKLKPKVGDEIMSLAEILREEGRTEEKIDTAKSLLDEGMEPAFVAKVTRLPLEKIKALQKKKKN